jgi:hypothetical protein
MHLFVEFAALSSVILAQGVLGQGLLWDAAAVGTNGVAHAVESVASGFSRIANIAGHEYKRVSKNTLSLRKTRSLASVGDRQRDMANFVDFLGHQAANDLRSVADACKRRDKQGVKDFVGLLMKRNKPVVNETNRIPEDEQYFIARHIRTAGKCAIH